MDIMEDGECMDDYEAQGGIILKESEIIEAYDVIDDTSAAADDNVNDDMNCINDEAMDDITVTEENSINDDDDDDDLGIEDQSSVRFLEHTDAVYAVSLSQNGQMALSCGGDDLAYLWLTHDGTVLHKLGGHEDSVISGGFNHDSSMVATGGMDGTIQIWCCKTGKLLCRLDGQSEEIEWLKWHSRGNIIIAGFADGMVWMWMVPSGMVMKILSGAHSTSTSCGTFTPDGKSIISASEDPVVAMWNPKNGEIIGRMDPFIDGRFHTAPITCVACHNDGNIVVTGSQDSTAKIVHLRQSKLLGSFNEHSDGVEDVAFSHVGSVATASLDGRLCIWDPSTFRTRSVFKHDDGVTRIAWQPQGNLIFSASLDRTVRAWDARSGQAVRSWTGHRSAILSLAVDSTGQTLITGGDDAAAFCWKL